MSNSSTSPRVRLGTKAETLSRLQGHLHHASVHPQLLFDVSTWRKDPENVLSEVRDFFAENTLVIVRSSARSEDSVEGSHAGEFLSVSGVCPHDPGALRSAILRVISSYPGDDVDNQFFLQEQLTDVAMSGVLLTRDLDTLAPYYVVNFDEVSGATDTVTSGQASRLRTYVRFRGCTAPFPNPSLRNLIEAAREIEQLVGTDCLDIEFGLDRSGRVWIFQVRPIALVGRTIPCDEDRFENLLYKISKKFDKLTTSHPGLCGYKGMYSVMTDWNPAEMIGLRPRKLALSLYRELITDNIWAYQRSNYGYRNLRSYPLMVSFLGAPYIDVRVSCNSFVPATLQDDLADRLVDYYVDRLAEHPTDHDKVEFNIVYSCYDLSAATRLRQLLNHGFSEPDIQEIKSGLIQLTNRIISPATGLYRHDFHRLELLKTRFDIITRSQLPLLDKIYWLVEDCKRYGTLPFAGLARAGFIAVQMLRSMVDQGIFEPKDLQRFLNSLNTVARQLTRATRDYRAGKMSREALLETFGHLRPGTYDILSSRYDEAFESYFRPPEGEEDPVSEPEEAQFLLSPRQEEMLERALTENDLLVSPSEILQFIREAIEGREYGKFVFTRHVSEILVCIGELGRRHSISREELADLDVRLAQDLYSNLTHEFVGDIFRENICKNRAAYQISRLLRLPQLIQGGEDAYHFFMSEVEPNFITDLRVRRPIAIEENLSRVDLKDKIVLIRGADPGYDWLFTRRISGLVTMFGGTNSHMAIRCAELRIPAVIGCGEEYYRSWSRARELDLDCANRQVRALGSPEPYAEEGLLLLQGGER